MPSIEVCPTAKYLSFERGPNKPKTKTWKVINEDSWLQVGIVSWFGPWRKYSFSPRDGTVLEEQCLRDIANFCEYQTKTHRRMKKEIESFLNEIES